MMEIMYKCFAFMDSALLTSFAFPRPPPPRGKGCIRIPCQKASPFGCASAERMRAARQAPFQGAVGMQTYRLRVATLRLPGQSLACMISE